MTEFDIVEHALKRYAPLGPSAAAFERITVSLATPPVRWWSTPWGRAAAAVILLSIPAISWVLIALTNAPEPAAITAQSSIPPAFAADWVSRQRIAIPGIDVKADVVVVGFNDWQCPPCLELYAALKAVIDDYARTHPGAVALVLLDWPWSARCNPGLTPGLTPLHAGACEAAQAVRVARDHGRGDDMVAWLRRNHESLQLAPDAVSRMTEYAKTLVPGEDVPALMSAAAPAIAHDVAIGQAVRIIGTPTFFVNGVRLTTVNVQEVEWAIRLELPRKIR